MTDRKLLELAAKAAGISGRDDWPLGIVHDERWWNPLESDADALRLAVKLRLVVGSDGQSCKPRVEVWRRHYPTPRVMEFEGSDPFAATRRAITNAAAEIGRQMP